MTGKKRRAARPDSFVPKWERALQKTAERLPRITVHERENTFDTPIRTAARRTLYRMGETLLYVDDDALRQEALAGRLRHLGYHVLTVSNGSDALKIFNSSRVDLAIVDYYMPGMNGDLLAIEMKDRKPNVPVIIFSGMFTLAEMVIALVDGFVSTSDDPEALLNKIGEILGPRRAERAS